MRTNYSGLSDTDCVGLLNTLNEQIEALNRSTGYRSMASIGSIESMSEVNHFVNARLEDMNQELERVGLEIYRRNQRREQAQRRVA